VLSPSTANAVPGASEAFRAEGFDGFGHDIDDVTGTTVFTVAGGTCTLNACRPTPPETTPSPANRVDRLAPATGTATLHVVARRARSHRREPGIDIGGRGVTGQAYTARGEDSFGNDLGDVIGSPTTFTMTPDGGCAGATCTATIAGAHEVKATRGTAQGTAALIVTAGPLSNLALSPNPATIGAGGTQAYTVARNRLLRNDLGTVTNATFTIGPDGACTGAVCGSNTSGGHTVHADAPGGASGEATLTINPAMRII